jgi:hypothetical protein
MTRIDCKKLGRWTMFLLIAATALATWACDGAPAPIIHKAEASPSDEDTDPASVGVDATQPPFDAPMDTKHDSSDASVEAD